VLVVEDDEADAHLICRALADNPTVGTVVRARDGVEAQALLRRGDFRPDLACIDLHMPRMDGFELLVALGPQARFPKLILTSSTAPKDAIRSRLRRAAQVIVKPACVRQLSEALDAAIEGLCGGGDAEFRRTR
jgi:DNA-binding response OmpR family regulator